MSAPDREPPVNHEPSACQLVRGFLQEATFRFRPPMPSSVSRSDLSPMSACMGGADICWLALYRRFPPIVVLRPWRRKPRFDAARDLAADRIFLEYARYDNLSINWLAQISSRSGPTASRPPFTQ